MPKILVQVLDDPDLDKEFDTIQEALKYQEDYPNSKVIREEELFDYEELR